MSAFDHSLLKNDAINLQGTLAFSGYAVTVNGVSASTSSGPNGTTQWQADDVPVSGGGTASFTVTATPISSGGSTFQAPFTFDKPTYVRVSRYEEKLHEEVHQHIFANACGNPYFQYYFEDLLVRRIRNWTNALGGHGSGDYKDWIDSDIVNGGSYVGPCHAIYDWPSEQWPPQTLLESVASVTCDSFPDEGPTLQNLFVPLIPWEHFDFGDEVKRPIDACDDTYTLFHRTAQTRLELVVGGPSLQRGPAMVLLAASAAEFTDPLNHFAGGEYGSPYPLQVTTRHVGDTPVLPENIFIAGQRCFAPVGVQTGLVFVAAPPGTTNVDVTPVVRTMVNDCYSFDVQVGNLKLEWLAKNDNPPIEDNNNPITGVPMPGGGKRIFVGAKTPTETNLRDTVVLRATLSPPLPNVRIYFQAFDVDDPSIDPEIDSTGAVGNDNFGADSTTAVFPATGTRNTFADTDSAGIATVEFRVGPHPGNNYRIAAALHVADLVPLTVDYPTLESTVPASDDQVPFFAGRVSPMLTVWRKLHIEVDSMSQVATNGTEKNFEEGSIVSYQENVPVTGQSTLSLSIGLGDHEFANGRIEIAGFAPTNVIDSIDINPGQNFPDDVIILGTPGTNVVGQSFRIYDDDDRFLAMLGLPAPLPKDNESTNIIEGIRSVFFPAYIDVTNANAEGFNPNKIIPFDLNEPVLMINFPVTSIFDDAKDLTDSTFFWCHTIVFGYQPEVFQDLDPDTQHPLLGGTPENAITSIAAGFSVIFVEANRDDAFLGVSESSILSNTNVWRSSYWNTLLGTAAHETGHPPGRFGETHDHNEGGLMQEGGAALPMPFYSPTIRRFRQAESWTD